MTAAASTRPRRSRTRTSNRIPRSARCWNGTVEEPRVRRFGTPPRALLRSSRCGSARTPSRSRSYRCSTVGEASMRLVHDNSWCRRGPSLLWGATSLSDIAKPSEILSIRAFFDAARKWPDELPSNGGRSLVVAGVEGCVDILPPEDAETWLEEELRPRILAFQEEYEGQAAL